MKFRFSIIFLLAVLSLPAFAKEITKQIGKVPDGYNFWLAEPDNVSEPKPVVIFLHGRSLCGSDLNKVKQYGTIDAIEKGRDIDAYVIAPQNPGGSWSPQKIMNVLEWVENNYNVDSDRVYVLGMSLGGYGTLDFTATYPDKVAAALAMCGGSTKKDLGVLNKVPLWIVHGTGDQSVSVSKSDNVVEAMKEVNPHTPRLSYDRIPGMNHSQPARIFYFPETYQWLMAHSLKDPDRPMAETFTIDSAKMSTAYKGLDFSKSKKTVSSKNTASSKKTDKSKKNASKKSASKKNASKKSSSKAAPKKSVKKKKK